MLSASKQSKSEKSFKTRMKVAALKSTKEEEKCLTQGIGGRLLKKMGWKDGCGLGAKEDGMVQHIKVQMKDNKTGVGFKSIAINVNDDGQLARHQKAYDSLLNTLNGRSISIDNPLEQKPDAREQLKVVGFSYKLIQEKVLKKRSAEDMKCIWVASSDQKCGNMESTAKVPKLSNDGFCYNHRDDDEDSIANNLIKSNQSSDAYFKSKVSLMHGKLKSTKLHGKDSDRVPTDIHVAVDLNTSGSCEDCEDKGGQQDDQPSEDHRIVDFTSSDPIHDETISLNVERSKPGVDVNGMFPGCNLTDVQGYIGIKCFETIEEELQRLDELNTKKYMKRKNSTRSGYF